MSGVKPLGRLDTSSLLAAVVGALIGGIIAGNKGGSGYSGTPGAPVSELQSLVWVKGGNAEPALGGDRLLFVLAPTPHRQLCVGGNV